MDANDIKELIEGALPDAKVSVNTRTDHPEDDHYEAEVISSAFEGETLVTQHEMVYNALEGHMTRDIHALELSTYTPSEATEL